MARIFISHSSKDKQQSARMKEWLADEGFQDAFLDFDKHSGIPPGADWERRLYTEIENCDAVVVILTASWFASTWCWVEFQQARALGKAIFPVIEAPTGETLVAPDIQHVDLTEDRDGGLERLARGLREVSRKTSFPWDMSRPPFPGLMAFQEADAAVFFGRDEEIDHIRERLNARRVQGGPQLLVLLGASGSGKSSLLRAGVLPRLKRDAGNWIVLPPFRPQLNPVEEFAKAVAVHLGRPMEWQSVYERLTGGNATDALSALATEIRMQAGATEAHILISIDQAEELFAGAGAAGTDRFLEVLSAAGHELSPFMAVAAMRSDFLGALQNAQGLTTRFETVPLKPMPLENLPDIIRGPARIARLKVDDGLIVAATRDAATRDALPLLAFALRELYEKVHESGELTAEDYQALGDAALKLSPLENAVRKAADAVIEAQAPGADELSALRDAFVPAMARVNDEGEYVRRAALWRDLPAASHELLERLARARLLVISGEGEDRSVEVAHEALLRKWPRLTAWLDEEREFLIGKSQLERDLEDWQALDPADRPHALLAGLKLSRAREWFANRPHQLTEDERTFIGESIEAEDAEAARKARMRRIVTWGSAAAAVIMTVLAATIGHLWLTAEDERLRVVRTQSMFLAETAIRRSRSGDPVTGMLVTLEGLDRAYVPNAEWSLYEALHTRRELLVIPWTEVPVASAFFDQKGQAVIAVTDSSVLYVFDLADGTPSMRLGTAEYKVMAAWSGVAGMRVIVRPSSGPAYIWSDELGARMSDLDGHTSPDITVHVSPSGTRILTIEQDGTGHVWDAVDGKRVASLQLEGANVSAIAFSHDDARLVYAHQDTSARVIDVLSGIEVAVLEGHRGPVAALAFSPDGSRVVTASKDTTARVWNVETAQNVAVLEGHKEGLKMVRFGPKGEKVVTVAAGNTSRIWDASNGRVLGALRNHEASINSVDISPDGALVVTASDDGTARIWDAVSGWERALLAAHLGPVRSARFSPDGRLVVTAAQDGTARLWDAISGTGVKVFEEITARQARARHGTSKQAGRNAGARLSADGNVMVTVSTEQNAYLWNTETGRRIADLGGHGALVHAAAVSPDGVRVVTGAANGTLHLFQVGRPADVGVLSGHKGDVFDVAFSADGGTIASGGADRTVRLWNGETGAPAAVLKGHVGPVTRLAFGPNGTLLASVSQDGTVRLWALSDKGTGEVLAGHTGPVLDAEFSPDGTRLVTGGEDGTVRIWDARTRAQLHLLEGHGGPVTDVTFSPDGNRIATASGDRTVRVWNVAEGTETHVLRGHEKAALTAAFDAAGRRIVSAGADFTARVWALSHGRQIAILRGHFDQVTSAAFAPSGRGIITASMDNTARLWTFYPTTQTLVDAVHASVPRCLASRQRLSFHLTPAPPEWCVQRSKWPYTSEGWAEWFADQSRPMPADDTLKRK